MRFDIKKWQDKHLIKESKLKKEIDFKDQKAFKKYDAKHKMRPTTKVTIGGKTTTAGDAGGGGRGGGVRARQRVDRPGLEHRPQPVGGVPHPVHRGAPGGQHAAVQEQRSVQPLVFHH